MKSGSPTVESKCTFDTDYMIWASTVTYTLLQQTEVPAGAMGSPVLLKWLQASLIQPDKPDNDAVVQTFSAGRLHQSSRRFDWSTGQKPPVQSYPCQDSHS